MKSHLKKIVEEKNPLRSEEIKEYLEGKLKGKERHEIEEKIADSALNSDALEAFANDPDALQWVPEKPAFLKSGSDASGNSAYRVLFIASSSIVVVLLVILIRVLNSGENKSPLAVLEHQSPSTPKQEIIVTTEEIDAAQPIEEKEQITYQKTVADQPKTQLQQKAAESPAEPELPKEEYTQKIEEKEKKEIEVKEEIKVAVSNVKFNYIHDLKVIDYGELYSDAIKKTEIILTGTPANMQNASSKNEAETGIRTVYVPYEKYLEETVYEFKQNHFKQALKNFTVILQHYPEDLNAYFYGGLCHYNLGKFNIAIQYFDHCIENSFSTFREEAEWYKALSLKKTGDVQLANMLFQKIADEKGFYAEKAKNQLQK